MSGEQAGERTAREGRAKQWLAANSVNGATEDGTWVQCATTEVVRIMAAYAEKECSRLARRVEELEEALRVIVDTGCDFCYSIAIRALKNGAGAHAEEK